MTAESCRPVEATVDGSPETIRMHGAAPMDDRGREALGELVAAVRERVAREHPHAGVVQELMLAWMQVRRALPAGDSAVKDRMSAAIRAVREALDGEA